MAQTSAIRASLRRIPFDSHHITRRWNLIGQASILVFAIIGRFIMSLGPWQLIIIALVILVLFGRGRISEMMGDFGKGIKSFKKGMNDEDAAAHRSAERIEGPAVDAKPASSTRAEPGPAEKSDTVG